MTSTQRVQQGTPIASLSLDQTQSNVASLIAAASSAQAALATAQAQQQQAEAQRTKAAANVQLLRTPGVGNLTIFGEKQYAMRLWLNPNALASRGLSVADVATALRSQNILTGEQDKKSCQRLEGY